MARGEDERLDKQALLERRRDDRDGNSEDDDTEYQTLLDDGKEPNPLHELEDEQDVLRAAKGRPVHAYRERAKTSLPLIRLRPSRTCLYVLLAIVAVLLVALFGGGYYLVYQVVPRDGDSPPFYPAPAGGTDPDWSEAYKKAAALVKRMSLMEKVNVTSGTNWAQDLCVGNTAPATGVGFPALCLQDGPLGIRFADHATAWPAGIHVGATWNKELMYLRGKYMGIEAHGKGINVVLGPSVGPIGRMPAGGRNWEAFGPDPALQGIAGALTVKGIQEQGVIATIKHFVGNEQEHFRQSWEWVLPNAMSTYIDDRTLHELYAWPFLNAIKEGVGSLMCSYNQVNSSYACGNSWLMNGVVKHEMGFQGFIQSDWLAKRSGVASALAGLDMDMPGDGLMWDQANSLWGRHLTMAVLNGSLPIDRLDDMALRIVAAWYQMGQDDKEKWPKQGPNGGDGPNFSSFTKEEVEAIHPGSGDNVTAVVNQFKDVQGFGSEFHGHTAKDIATEGIVLLKNEDHVLPFNSTQMAIDAGKRGRKFKIGVFGEDAGPPPGGPNVCADRSCNVGTLAMGWGSGAVEFPYLVDPLRALESAFDFDVVDLAVDLSNSPSQKGGRDRPSPSDQDFCLVFANADAGEGFHSWDGVNGDRNDLNLQKGGDALIEAVAKRCGGPVVVIIHTVGPIVMERWIDHAQVKAVLNAGLPGEESGNALTDVLFGRADATGRLPYTIPMSQDDFGEAGKIMYRPNGPIPTQNFTEGLLIDYRHLDEHQIAPRFEFGFGLSYTEFETKDFKLTQLKEKSLLADALPSGQTPPAIEPNIPDPRDALFPQDFRRLAKRNYPYLDESDLPNATPNHGAYPYPEGYLKSFPTPRSRGSGGFQGGNPSLWDAHVELAVTVTNVGPRPGKQVVQAYVAFEGQQAVDMEVNETVRFPPNMLRQFEKTRLLMPGESQKLVMTLNRRDLSYWSTLRQEWVMPEAEITVRLGTSSRDIFASAKW